MAPLKTPFWRLIRLLFFVLDFTMGSMVETLGVSQTPNKPKLLEQLREAIRRKHYSIRTERTYCDWVKRYILSMRNAIPRKWLSPRLQHS